MSISIETTDIINCTYGHLEPNHSTCYVATLNNGVTAYCLDDSVNVNFTCDEVEEGVHVENLQDVDCSTSNESVDSRTRFIHNVQLHIDYLNEQGEY